MVDPPQVRFVGPLARHQDSLRDDLRTQGYAPYSARNVLHVSAHLSRWLDAQSLDACDLDSKRIDEFLEHRRAVGYTHFLSPRGLKPILEHLRHMGAIPIAPTPLADRTGIDGLLDAYDDYLVRERSLVFVTRQGYLRVVRQFLSTRFSKENFDVAQLRPADIASFLLRESKCSSIGSMKGKVTSLRSFLRYLHIKGDIDSNLATSVPAIAGWRLAGLPKYLSKGQVKKLLNSCDRRTAVGRRDFAAILLMFRLGLRAGEVASIALDDIDWHSAEMVIRGKGRHEDRLPLPHDVGEAIVSYLKHGRPRSTLRQLFLRARAPNGELTSGSVQAIVQNAGKRIGVSPLGAHRLRHTAATQMLRRGASLPHIAQVLRHRHLDTTAIYAKVDRSRLRTLARRWPGGKR
jgi:integrase/recombinase XerD